MEHVTKKVGITLFSAKKNVVQFSLPLFSVLVLPAMKTTKKRKKSKGQKISRLSHKEKEKTIQKKNWSVKLRNP